MIVRRAGAAVVATSAVFQVNAVLLGDVLVDSVYLPEELEALPGRLGAAPRALVATHPHFDHLLGPYAFPGVPLHAPFGLAGVPGELREADGELYVERAPWRPPPAGPRPAGLEAIDAPGHAEAGIALWWEEEAVLVPGDYLIGVEIPLVSRAGSPEAYLATLERLEPYVRRAAHVIPGHGAPLDREGALRLLELDLAYVRALAEDPETAVPRDASTAHQRQIHADNLAKHPR